MISNWFSQKGGQIAQIIGRWILLFSLVIGFALPSRAQDEQDIRESCRNFVQSFYDWYVKRPDWPRAVRDRPSAFSPELSRALKEDHEAQAKAEDIVGLDWDPILSGNGRPFGGHYVVRRITLKTETDCWAEMHDTPSGKISEKAVVAAELVNKDGQWRFVNFYYPLPNSDFSVSVSHGGLLTMLKRMREARQKAAKRPAAAAPTLKPQEP